MRGKLMFGAGVGIGYLLGTRAGRERFDKISGQAKRLWESNRVQEAAGVVQSQAGRLYDEGKKMVTEQAHKMREHQGQGKNHSKHNRALNDRNRNEAGWEAPSGMPAGAGTNPY